jgi:hypothetical protein
MIVCFWVKRLLIFPREIEVYSIFEPPVVQRDTCAPYDETMARRRPRGLFRTQLFPLGPRQAALNSSHSLYGQGFT